MTKKKKRLLKNQLDAIAQKHGRNINSANHLELVEKVIQYIETYEQRGETLKVIGATTGDDFFEFDLQVENPSVQESGSGLPIIDLIFGKGSRQKILQNRWLKSAVIGLNDVLAEGLTIESEPRFTSFYKVLRKELDEFSGIDLTSKNNFDLPGTTHDIADLLSALQEAKAAFTSIMGIDCDLIHAIVMLTTREYIVICSRLEYKENQESLTEDECRMLVRATKEFHEIVSQWISDEPSGSGGLHH